ncbi:MAG TPA: LacI family DNA-binding transcriptional regulator [Lichenihabitans sp.]|nr:LacI family DNA-binding transcriptional regulator [Lichenihabitans sp.]
MTSVPTIKQVAEAAGVSRATVSRAFGAPHLLSQATVEGVRAAAERLGYVPNQTARALSTGRAGNIALIVPDITNPFFAALMRGAQAQARDRGFATFLGDCDETPELEDVLMTKLASQVDGFVLVSPRLDRARIEAHLARRPLVLVNRDLQGFSRLLIDTRRGYARAVEHLAALGHRAVVYVAGPALSWSNAQRLDAVEDAAARTGLSFREVPTSRPSFEAGQACVEAVLSSGATAALTFDDTVAQGVMAGLAERGLSVPSDFSVVGCDGIIAPMIYPGLSSVTIGCATAGRQAVDLLVAQLQGARSASLEKLVVPAEFVARATTARPAKVARAAATARKAREPAFSAPEPIPSGRHE